MNEDTGDKSPTLNPLKTNLSESPTAPGKITRTQTVRAHDDAELSEVMEEIKLGYSVFLTLKDKYRIKIPDFTYEIRDRRDTGYATMYTEVDKIEGVNVDEGDLPADASAKFDEFYKTMIDYYADIYAAGGNYWGDFRNDQLVYGHRQGDTESEIYVVDIDPSNIGIAKYNKSNKGVSNEKLFRQFFNVAFAITQAERKLGSSSKLAVARQEFLGKISAISITESHHKILEEAQQLLTSK